MEFEKIQKIISEVLGVDEDTVTMETTFVDDLGADSLDVFQIIMALEEEIKETQAKYDALVTDMDRRIKAVEDSDARDLLTKRYLEFKTWNAIAAEFGYSVQHIYRLHAKAVEKLRVDEST